jgi:predicted  nucleic acid-binding Zn-ribbon protein
VFVPIGNVKVLAVGGGDERIQDLQKQLNQAYKEMASLKYVYEKHIVDLGGTAEELQHTGVDLPPRAIATMMRPASREATDSTSNTPARKGSGRGRAEKELLLVIAELKTHLARVTSAPTAGAGAGVAHGVPTSVVAGGAIDTTELTRLHDNLMHKDDLLEAQLAQLGEVQEEVGRLKIQLSEEQATASFCQKELDLLRERMDADIAQLQGRLDKTESALDRKDVMLQVLQDEHRQLQTAHDVLKANGGAAPTATMAITPSTSDSSNAESGVAAAALQRENDALLAQRTALDARIVELTTEVSQLKSELVSVRDKADTTAEERSTALSEAGELKVELATLKGELSAARAAVEAAIAQPQEALDDRSSPSKMVDSLLHQDRQALSELLTTHFEHIQALKSLQHGDGAVGHEISKEVDDMIALHMESLTKRLTKCEDAMDVHYSRGQRESVSVEVDLQGEDFF